MPITIQQKLEKTDVLLNVENLNTQFFTDDGIVKAVNGISFTLNKRERLGVVGESGCGKSAHARSIMGLVNHSGGGAYQADKIWFNGRDLLKLSPKELRKICGSEMAMVFQDPMASLNPVLKIGDQLSEALKLHNGMNSKQAWKRSEELVGLVRIPDAAEKLQSYPHQLSGGMQQRVMIAMALSCNPKLLIADEPTTALDVTIQARIIELVIDIQKEFGMAIIWITHDLGIIANLAETVNVMYAGSIIERGKVLNIYTHPSHPYTQGLLGALPYLGRALKKLSSIPGAPPNLINLPPGCAFAPRCSYAKDICYQQKPDLDMANSEDHFVACFFWKEIEVQRKNKLFSSDNSLEDVAVKAKGNSVLLSVKNIKTYFPITKGVMRHHVGDIKAVDSVSFEINQGETLGLVGESGSGKTTLGRSIIRLVKTIDGRIIFKGKDITSINNIGLRHIRPKIQLIFQNPYLSLNPRITIGSIISTPLEVHKVVRGAEKHKRIKELMEMVGLNPAYINRYPHEFSGGQQQRVGIARALALSPDLIICDEPISALDVSIQAQIVNLLECLQDQLGIAYLFISHDLNMAYHISDRIAVMYMGKIMELAGKDELYSNPQHPYTRFLLSAIPVADPAIEKKHTLLYVKGDDIPSAANPPIGCKFNTRCPFAEKVCFDLEPEYKEITPGHYCSCHLIH